MLELQESKHVRRRDLRSSSLESLSSNASAQARLREKFINDYEITSSNDLAQVDLPHEDAKTQEDEEAFEFPLFSKSKSDPSATNVHSRVVIRSPTPISSEPGFVQPKRPDSYYFTFGPSREQRKQYDLVAVNGEDVLRERNVRWPGFELPWRVTTIKMGRREIKAKGIVPTPHETLGRKRAGKKRRIAIRTKIALNKQVEAAAKQKQCEKEAAEREKRARKNREKKVKKRQRDKLKKIQEAEGEKRTHDY